MREHLCGRGSLVLVSGQTEVDKISGFRREFLRQLWNRLGVRADGKNGSQWWHLRPRKGIKVAFKGYVTMN